jgi:S-formylglutathione hydrolase FrmB
MPSCENSFYIDDETTCQFYEKFISEELVDFTRKAFRLSDKREDTTIAGLSMGGYGALRDGMRNSSVFGSIFALSSALITDEIAGMKEGGRNAVAPYSYYRHVFGDLDHLLGSDNDPRAVAEKMVKGKASIDYSSCIRCYCCHEMCPEGAIQLRRGGIARLTERVLDGLNRR